MPDKLSAFSLSSPRFLLTGEARKTSASFAGDQGKELLRPPITRFEGESGGLFGDDAARAMRCTVRGGRTDAGREDGGLFSASEEFGDASGVVV